MDDIFFSRVRLAIVARLLRAQWVAFTDLQAAADVTRGNLASHISKLIACGALDEDKRIVNGRSLTRYRLTRVGRAAFLQHMRHVQSVFEAVQREYTEADAVESAKPAKKKTRSGPVMKS
jgi:predicted ArsR family transcriptional regulator